MTLNEFNLLENNSKKAEVVWEHGVYIASRISPLVPDVKILLYQLPRFYVEMYYNNNENKILRLLSFCSVDNLEPYLSNPVLILILYYKWQ
jgi:hypothetical protein